VEPDPLLRRVLLYDRWTDLYHQPDGQTVNRIFNAGVPAGTPEADWGALERFAGYGGRGDSAIWSGTALVAYALRYLCTGTSADYQRMETKTRRLLAHFDVTTIPGYLARYHFLDLPADAPRSDQHLLTYEGEFDFRYHAFDPAPLQGLPAAYRDGITDESNHTWQGTPYALAPLAGLTLATQSVQDRRVLLGRGPAAIVGARPDRVLLVGAGLRPDHDRRGSGPGLAPGRYALPVISAGVELASVRRIVEAGDEKGQPQKS